MKLGPDAQTFRNRLDLSAFSTLVNFPLQSRSTEANSGGHSALAPIASFRTYLDVNIHIGLRPASSAAISRKATNISDSRDAAVAVSFSFPDSNARAVTSAHCKD